MPMSRTLAALLAALFFALPLHAVAQGGGGDELRSVLLESKEKNRGIAIYANGVADFGATQGDIGWVLDDNQGMNAVADAIDARINRVYQIYDKSL